MVASIRDAVGASIVSINEGRAKLGYGPTKGGESPLSQQQYYSLEALAKRDAQADPFAPKTLPAPSAPPAGSEKPPLPPPVKEFTDLELAAITQEFTLALKAA